MWLICLCLSLGALIGFIMLAISSHRNRIRKKRKANIFNLLFAGVFSATLLMFLAAHTAVTERSLLGVWQAFLLSVFNAMQVFTIGCEFSVVQECMASCPEWLNTTYQSWAATLFVVAPFMTFGFVLSLFKNISAYLKYLCAFFRDVYVFSELNGKSLTLATDIKTKYKRAAIVFMDVFEENEESSYELIEEAKQLGAICFKKDILVVDFKKHSRWANLWFFTIDENETENMNQALRLIELYRDRKNTNIYAFSTKIEGELLLTTVDKGVARVRRVNEVQSLINRVLYERGEIIYDSAREQEDGTKRISAVVLGMGNHGTEMVKALSWFGQMDGYTLSIDAFDKDPLAEDRFVAMAPELMSPEYNGIIVEGEAQYTIRIHSGIDVETNTFMQEINKLKDASYVLVALGNDDRNVQTAVNLRMYFERMKIHPVIQAIVYNSPQKKALEGIRNFRGQSYDIEFIGDMESSFTENVIIDSELEEDALRSHMKWGEEDTFWTYEYNYRSSMASAIHRNIRIKRGVAGAEKKEEELTKEERDAMEMLEHRRWNAYMRAEGYVYSGSKDKSSRNDLGKMHHDLIDFASLSEEDKRKDSRVGSN